jgi:hypothetical protein
MTRLDRFVRHRRPPAWMTRRFVSRTTPRYLEKRPHVWSCYCRLTDPGVRLGQDLCYAASASHPPAAVSLVASETGEQQPGAPPTRVSCRSLAGTSYIRQQTSGIKRARDRLRDPVRRVGDRHVRVDHLGDLQILTWRAREAPCRWRAQCERRRHLAVLARAERAGCSYRPTDGRLVLRTRVAPAIVDADVRGRGIGTCGVIDELVGPEPCFFERATRFAPSSSALARTKCGLTACAAEAIATSRRSGVQSSTKSRFIKGLPPVSGSL